MDLEAIGGDGADKTIGSLSGLNDDAGSLQDGDGVDRVSVREAWLQSELFKQHVRLVAGKIDLTNYFDINNVANDETTQFITSVFVNNPVLETPENGPGIASFMTHEEAYSSGWVYKAPITPAQISPMVYLGLVKLACGYAISWDWRVPTGCGGK